MRSENENFGLSDAQSGDLMYFVMTMPKVPGRGSDNFAAFSSAESSEKNSADPIY